MTARQLFASVHRHPGMHFLDGSYATAVAYVLGYAAGDAGGPVSGFHDWLVARLGGGQEFAWPALVLRVCFRDDPAAWRLPVDPAREAAAVDGLFALLDEFLAEQARTT